MNDSFFILRVALDVPLRRLFDYLPAVKVPKEAHQPGCRVRVPFGRRMLVGIIVEISTTASVAIETLKAADAILDESPVLSAPLLNLSTWSADYYQHPPGEVFLQSLPTLLRQEETPEQPIIRIWALREGVDLQNLSLRGPRLRMLLDELARETDGINETELRRRGYNSGQIKKLESASLIVQYTRTLGGRLPAMSELEQSLCLSPAQQHSLDSLIHSFGRHQGYLLYGVTGSGKTEVYLQWITFLLENDRQVLVLVPEISLTPQTLARFQRRFGNIVAGYHSGLTELERWRTWDNARQGQVKIVIGTRSSIFLGFQSLGAIIVDEEHDSSYKQQEGFRYSARDLAMVRGKMENVAVLLGSATPSLESLRNVELGKYALLRLDERAGAAQPAQIRLMDIKSRPLQAGLSKPLIEQIKKHLDQREQVLVFINRRGYAPVLMCYECGWMAECRHCDARMTLHKKPPSLRCHHCDHTTPTPRICPKCDSPSLQPIGTGTERTEDELQRLFPETAVYRVDSDTTRSKKRFADTLNNVHEGEPCILVGTQILAKGHHFPKVTLVAVVNADSGLFSSDFRATERMVQTLVQVAGRSGRENAKGQVIIQTHHADHPLLMSISGNDYWKIANDLLQERKRAELPPYHAMALLQAEGKTLQQPMQWLAQQRKEAERAISTLPDAVNIRFVGPLPALMERRADRYRAQLQLTAPARSSLKNLIAYLLNVLETQKSTSGLRWSIDVDPIDLL